MFRSAASRRKQARRSWSRRRTDEASTEPEAASTANSIANISANLAALFECLICFDYVLPPIFQCQQGHLICNGCRSRVSTCPICRDPLSNIRNRALEELFNAVAFSCTYASRGCPVSAVYREKLDHEDSCEFRPYVCPYPGAFCTWSGDLADVIPHVLSHNQVLSFRGDNVIHNAKNIQVPASACWAMLLFCFDKYFLSVLFKRRMSQGDQFYTLVQLIGSEEADQFTYRLEIGGQERQLVWKATPFSIRDNFFTIGQFECLEFPAATAQLLADKGELKINIKIEQCAES